MTPIEIQVLITFYLFLSVAVRLTDSMKWLSFMTQLSLMFMTGVGMMMFTAVGWVIKFIGGV